METRPPRHATYQRRDRAAGGPNGGGCESGESGRHAGLHEIHHAVPRRQPAAVRSISRKAFDRSAMSCAEWRATILELWRSARYREERYAALFLLGLKRRRACLTPKQMPMLEELIVTGAWWAATRVTTRLGSAA